MTALRRHGHEMLELAETLLRQHPVVLGVEQTGGGLAHRRRAIRSGTKMHAAFAFIAQIQLGKCGLVAARERRLCAALFLQPGKREFEVLAGPQFAGGIIGARTEIAARPQASNRHAIAGFRHGIADPKLGEKRFAGQIFKPEGLLAAELSAQAALPVHRRQIGRAHGCGKAWVPWSAWQRDSVFGAWISSRCIPYRKFHQSSVRARTRCCHSRSDRAEAALPHSHSIVPGGLLVTSYTTRFTPFTSLMIRVAVSPRNFMSKA